MPLASILTWLERRQSAMMQDRLGPEPRQHRPGSAPGGITHFLADALKFIFKEDFVRRKAHKFLFMWAPIMAMAPALIVAAIIPFGPPLCWGAAARRRTPALQPAGRAADRAARRRPPLLLRHLVAGRLRRHAGRLGLAQQVGDDGRPARQLADDVLRGHDGHGGPRRRSWSYGTLEPGAIVAQQTHFSASATTRRAGGSSPSRSASSCS